MKFLKTRTNSDRVLSAKDSPTRRWNEKISEDSKVGDPSYFISRWYVTPCRPSRRPLSNISVFTFDGLLSTSQPARLTRWKNKGKGRLADIYPSLWCAFSRREEEIIRGQVRGGIITLVIRERRCVWEKMRKIKKGGRGRDEDIWIFDARVTVISRKRGISKGS